MLGRTLLTGDLFHTHRDKSHDLKVLQYSSVSSVKSSLMFRFFFEKVIFFPPRCSSDPFAETRSISGLTCWASSSPPQVPSSPKVTNKHLTVPLMPVQQRK